MGFNSLHIDLLQARGDQHASGKIENLVQRRLAVQLVDRGTMHHSFHRNLRTYRRHQDGVARQQAVGVRADASQQEVIQVNFADQLCAAVLAQDAQRPAAGWAAGGVQGAQRRGQRADIIGAGPLHVAHHIHANGAQPAQGDFDMLTLKLRS